MRRQGTSRPIPGVSAHARRRAHERVGGLGVSRAEWGAIVAAIPGLPAEPAALGRRIVRVPLRGRVLSLVVRLEPVFVVTVLG